MRVLLTGATGFVGGVLCETLARSGHLVRAALRNERLVPQSAAEHAVVGDIAAFTDWSIALRDVNCVLHIAARAHVLHDRADDSDLYVETNARGTLRLAEAAAQLGVSRFIYLSTVKVNGEETTGHAFTPFDEPRPQDAYGASKWLGEKSLMEVAARTAMLVSIVRSPLVYGPGVRANFLRLLRWVDAEWPLPLGAVANSRSLVSVWNLCDLLVHLLESPVARGGTWMVSDGEDLSTPDLVRRIGNAMGRRAKLLPVPVGLLHLLGGLTGRRAEVARLCGSLTVDISRTRSELRWSPPVTVDEALSRTVDWYLSESRQRAA